MRYLQSVLVFFEDCVLSVPVKSFLFELSFYGLNAQLTSLKIHKDDFSFEIKCKKNKLYEK